MKHIAKLRLENFQSHVDSTLEFSPGLNILTGESNHGKSAVLRALYWLLYNRPQGVDHVRYGCRECRVTVTMSDGAEIVRELRLAPNGAAARNRYTVTQPGGEPQVFEGFGQQGIPQQVTQAHGMPIVALDDDRKLSLSFGSQLEGPFLLTETGSMRAAAIGRLLGAHVVDAAIRDLQQDLQRNGEAVATLEADLTGYDAKLEPFADLPQQAAQLEAAAQIIAAIPALQQRVDQLQGFRTRRDQIAADGAAIAATLTALAGIDMAALHLAQARTAHGRVTLLGTFRDRRQVIQTTADRIAAVLAETAGVEAAQAHLTAARVAEERRKQLAPLVFETERLRLARLNIADALTQTAGVPEAAQALTAAQAAHTRIQNLAPLRERRDRIQAERVRIDRALAETAGAEAAAVTLTAARQVQDRMNLLAGLRVRRETLAVQRQQTEAIITRANVDLDTLTAEYAQTLVEARICPTCGQSISEAAADVAANRKGGHAHAA
jgi:exonuclease SbcC